MNAQAVTDDQGGNILLRLSIAILRAAVENLEKNITLATAPRHEDTRRIGGTGGAHALALDPLTHLNELDLHGTVLATVFHPWNGIDTMLAMRITQLGLHRVKIYIDAIKLRVESTQAQRCITLALPKVGAAGALAFGGLTLAKR
ncbi:hypothetical protein PHLGIDRAFT_18335 [Phlebiopsis gigantea 11061_1 CR5-6]|uniref:Uncharacterized protein n=1 Tax=Phlebiopsis gigantea (strain 11061_1 CR5-6) TaxID=745531 RepID=A0A0C3S433_PHLG1|nr:hypothetical protein PHLGIDRAFT_18335 [Phlebiopsis gigantea 11061_1 CR5-6]